MAKVPILIVLLPHLLCTLLEVSGQHSPCYEYFTYIIDPATRQWMGQIQIPSAPRNVELYLKVTLSIGVALSTNYVGLLKVAQPKEEFVRMDQRDKLLLYHIHFPLLEPIPLLTGIWFNHQQYCSGPHATGQVVTFITLDHTLYRSSVLPHSQSSYDSPQQNLNTSFQPNIFLSTPQPTVPVYTSTLHTPLTQRPISSSDEIDKNPFLKPPPIQQSSECGISSPPITDNSQSSNEMKTASQRQFSWSVAILYNITVLYRFLCVGSILTKKHVITVAHCFKAFTRTDALVASFGKDLLPLHPRSSGFIYREIAYFTLHPDYNSSSADSDLAIVTLKTPIEFSLTIKPICMWYGSIDLQSVVNMTGYVMGKEHYIRGFQIMKASIVSQETCLRSHPAFSSVTSNRTFCAGMRYFSGSCLGADGSGLMFYDPTTQRYQLRGIISRFMWRLDNNKWTCNLTQYVVFVDVAKHLSWIYQQISTEQQYYQQDPNYL
ncbi:Serine protease gd [Camponotus japonicus]